MAFVFTGSAVKTKKSSVDAIFNMVFVCLFLAGMRIVLPHFFEQLQNCTIVHIELAFRPASEIPALEVHFYHKKTAQKLREHCLTIAIHGLIVFCYVTESNTPNYIEPHTWRLSSRWSPPSSALLASKLVPIQ